MALTPYPNTRRVIITFRPLFIKIIRDLDRRFENPSILFSEDEISFTERNIQNPIYPSPKSAKRFKSPHNYDLNLTWNTKREEVFLFLKTGKIAKLNMLGF